MNFFQKLWRKMCIAWFIFANRVKMAFELVVDLPIRIEAPWPIELNENHTFAHKASKKYKTLAMPLGSAIQLSRNVRIFATSVCNKVPGGMTEKSIHKLQKWEHFFKQNQIQNKQKNLKQRVHLFAGAISPKASTKNVHEARTHCDPSQNRKVGPPNLNKWWPHIFVNVDCKKASTPTQLLIEKFNFWLSFFGDFGVGNHDVQKKLPMVIKMLQL